MIYLAIVGVACAVAYLHTQLVLRRVRREANEDLRRWQRRRMQERGE